MRIIPTLLTTAVAAIAFTAVSLPATAGAADAVHAQKTAAAEKAACRPAASEVSSCSMPVSPCFLTRHRSAPSHSTLSS